MLHLVCYTSMCLYSVFNQQDRFILLCLQSMGFGLATCTTVILVILVILVWGAEQLSIKVSGMRDGRGPE